MEYFAGLDVSMIETYVCRNPRRYRHSRGAGAVNACLHCSCAQTSPGMPAGPVRDRPDGADAVPWLEPAWITRRLRREPAGLSGVEVVSDAQDRPQRCARPSASRPDRLLQTR